MFAGVLTRLRDAVASWHLGVIAVFMAIIFSLFWSLGTVPSGLSTAEKLAVQSSSSLKEIAENPINTPHKLLQYLLAQPLPNNQMAVRSASAFFAFFFILSMFIVLKHWFGNFIGLLGVLLFASTPLLLILGRSATPEIMLISFLLPMGYYLGFSKSRRQLLFCLGLATVAATVLYQPAGVWVLLGALLLWRKTIQGKLNQLGSLSALLCGGLFAVLIIPLLANLTDIGFVKQLLLLPSHWPTLIDFLKNLVWAPIALVAHAPRPSVFLVGQVAILSLTQVAFMFLGLVAMYRRAARETILILILMLAGFILSALNSQLYILLMVVPAALLFSAAGLRFLYTEWKTVFPKNPLPHFFAVTLLILVCIQQFIYGVHYSHRVWPLAPPTKSVYVLKLSK